MTWTPPSPNPGNTRMFLLPCSTALREGSERRISESICWIPLAFFCGTVSEVIVAGLRLVATYPPRAWGSLHVGSAGRRPCPTALVGPRVEVVAQSGGLSVRVNRRIGVPWARQGCAEHLN